MVESLGFPLIVVSSCFLLVILCILIKKAFNKKSKVHKITKVVVDKLCFNFFIRSYVSGYLMLSLSATKNLYVMSFKSLSKVV